MITQLLDTPPAIIAMSEIVQPISGSIVIVPSELPIFVEERTEFLTIEVSTRYQLTPAGPIIQAYSNSWIIHTDLVLDDGKLLGATPLGVRIRTWTPTFKTKRYRLAVTPSEKEEAISYAMAQVGKPYSYTNMVFFGVRDVKQDAGKLWDNEYTWMCSKLVVAVAKHIGYDLTGKPAYASTPAEIAASLLLTEVK